MGLLLALLALTGGFAWAEGEITAVAQLNAPGMTVGVDQGSAAENIVRAELPKARIEYFNDKPSAYMAVAQGKLDAFIYDYNQMRFAIENGVSGVHLLEKSLGEPVRIAVGISPATKLPDLANRLNRFIAEARADGTLDDMYKRWVIDGNEAMPDIPVPESAPLRLTVGTTGIVQPYSYYVGTELAGYDIELARRFAAWLGAELQLKVYDYGAIIPACATGDVDCVMANLNITPERAEALPFSDVLYEDKLGVMVRGEAADPNAMYGEILRLNGARIGVQTGTSFDGMVSKSLPDAQVEYYNTKADLVAALTGDKIDAIVLDEPVAQILMRESDEVTYLPEYLDSYEFAAVFPKGEAGEALKNQFNAFLDQLPEGALDELAQKWFGEDEDAKTMPDLAALSAANGTLRLATESGYVPFEYVRDGDVVGYDMDLAARFCEYAGYGLEIVDMNFDGILPAVQAGKCEFSLAGISVTPERAESIAFSNPYFSGGAVAVVRKTGETASQTGESVQPEFTEFSQLSGKTVSMLTGAPFEELVKSKAPDVGEFTFFNSTPDMIQALKSQKTDAFLMNNAVGQLALNRNPDLALFPQSLQDGAFGIAFAKGDPRRDEWQAAYDAIPRSEIEAAWEKWTGADDSVKVLPEQDWPGANGTVKVAACDTLEPMSYVGGDNELKGFDLEIILMMARTLDVKVEFTGMEFSAILAAVQSGKADLGAGSIIATLHILQAHQSIVGNGNHTLTWVAVGSREGVELLDKGRLKACLLPKLTQGAILGTFIHAQEAARQSPFPLIGVDATLYEQHFELSAVKTKNHAVGSHRGVRIFVTILLFFFHFIITCKFYAKVVLIFLLCKFFTVFFYPSPPHHPLFSKNRKKGSVLFVRKTQKIGKRGRFFLSENREKSEKGVGSFCPFFIFLGFYLGDVI